VYNLLYQKLSKDILDIHYNKIKDNLNAGTDRITATNFETNKNVEFVTILNKFDNKTYKFSSLKSISLCKDRVVYIPTIRDRIIIEVLKNKLISKYHINFDNRDSIIKSIKSKLNSKLDFHIIRLDIKNFFESIPQNNLLHKLKESALLSSSEYYLIKEILKLCHNGVPQGLSISNALSEIYLETLDFELKNIHPRINYYCRFVDDILIIINGKISSDEKKEIETLIHNIFKNLNLRLNAEKMSLCDFPHTTTLQGAKFDYLGYQFTRNNSGLDITISENKLNRFFNKIDFCFRDYKRNSNFNLLLERLRFLSSKNVIIKKQVYIDKKYDYHEKNKMIYFGIIENYKYVDKKTFERIDKYIIGKVNSTKSLFNRDEKRKLHSISLAHNFENNHCNRMYRYKNIDFINRIINIAPQLKTSSLIIKKRTALIEMYFNILGILN
jgi:hypothetical protein